jgi:hypothetical protein
MITQNRASSPEVEASGASILTVTAGMASNLRPLLEKHGLEDVHEDHWYPQQAWLDFLADLESLHGAGVADLVSIGMEIARVAKFPPHIHDLDTALNSLGDAYHMNNRNDDPGRGWTCEQVDRQNYRLVCTTPVPRDFEYGVVYGLVKRFRPRQDMNFYVYREPQEDGSCIFRVRLA